MRVARAISEGRPLNGAYLLRSGEFFMWADDPDKAPDARAVPQARPGGAQDHCQVGNPALALDVITRWIDEATEHAATGIAAAANIGKHA